MCLRDADNLGSTIAFGFHMQLDASSFMRNCSLLYLEGAQEGEGPSIKVSDTIEIIGRRRASKVLTERTGPLLSTESQQGVQQRRSKDRQLIIRSLTSPFSIKQPTTNLCASNSCEPECLRNIYSLWNFRKCIKMQNFPCLKKLLELTLSSVGEG